MTSYNVSSSIEIFRLHSHQYDALGECDGNDSKNDHPPPIAVVSSFDLETIRSYPGITKNGSMNSFTTQWSTAMTQTANTTKRNSEKKHEKSRFLHFVKILMRIVKEKDDERFQNAKAIVCNCEQQKRRGEIMSLSESLRCPLKDAVGPYFWGEARERLSRALLYSKTKRSINGATIESGIYAPDTKSSARHEEGRHLPSSSKLESKTTGKNTVTAAKIKEMRTRKKRLWMIIRVFMQYLQNKNCRLYRKAYILVNECVRLHKKVQRFEHCNSLSGSIQACLKKEIGLEYWRRAEYFVADILRARHEDRR